MFTTASSHFVSTYSMTSMSRIDRTLKFSYLRRKAYVAGGVCAIGNVSRRRHSQSSGLDASFLRGGWSTEPSHSSDRQHARCEVVDAVVVAGSDGIFDLEVKRSAQGGRRICPRTRLSHTRQASCLADPAVV